MRLIEPATCDLVDPADLPTILAPMGRYQPLPLDVEQLQTLLEAAGETLMRLAVRRTYPAGFRQYWPDVLHEVMEAYGYTEEDMPIAPPRPRQVSAMDEAFGWVLAHIPPDPPHRGEAELYSRHGGAVTRRLILMRALISPRSGRNVFSLRRLAKALHCSPEAARQWHARGLERIVAGIHRPPTPSPPRPAPVRVASLVRIGCAVTHPPPSPDSQAVAPSGRG